MASIIWFNTIRIHLTRKSTTKESTFNQAMARQHLPKMMCTPIMASNPGMHISITTKIQAWDFNM